jgi:hypothetical protein
MQVGIDRGELPGMLATLASYEGLFGPHDPQTLRLLAHIAVACLQIGETAYARLLLERAVRDMGRYLARDHELRIGTIEALRTLLIAQQEYGRAALVHKELLECQIQRLGGNHPETLATRASLAAFLLERCSPESAVAA